MKTKFDLGNTRGCISSRASSAFQFSSQGLPYLFHKSPVTALRSVQMKQNYRPRAPDVKRDGTADF